MSPLGSPCYAYGVVLIGFILVMFGWRGTLVPFSRRLDIGGTKKVEEATLGISGNVPKLLAVKSLMFLASSAHGEIIYLITI